MTTINIARDASHEWIEFHRVDGYDEMQRQCARTVPVRWCGACGALDWGTNSTPRFLTTRGVRQSTPVCRPAEETR